MRKLTCFLVIFSLFSCSSGSEEPIQPNNDFLGTGWKMSSYKLLGQSERAAYENGSLSFILQSSSNQTSGFVECNAFIGTYALDGELLSFLTVEADTESCWEENQHYQEQSVLIGTATREQLQASIENTGLSLTNASGDIMYFDVYPEVFNSTR